jgi:hypothetical protein
MSKHVSHTNKAEQMAFETSSFVDVAMCIPVTHGQFYRIFS